MGDKIPSRTDNAGWEVKKRHLVTQPFVHAVDGSAVPLVMCDAGETLLPVIYANDSAFRLTGYEEAEFLGAGPDILDGPDGPGQMSEAMREAVATAGPVSREARSYRKDGTAFWNEVHVAPVYDHDGKMSVLMASMIDVTDRHVAEAGLRAANERLEERVAERTAALAAESQKSELFAKEMTHRVKNSLAILGAMMEMHRRSAKSDTERAILSEVSGRIRAVARIQQLLDGLDPEAQQVPLRSLVLGLCEDLEKTSGNRLAATAKTARQVRADQALPVALILTELVLNAQKHAFGPGRTGIIRVDATDDEGDVVLEVSDNGNGLPEDFQVEAMNGTGMLVVRGQVDTLNGRIETGHSAAGGARFTVRFPA